MENSGDKKITRKQFLTAAGIVAAGAALAACGKLGENSTKNAGYQEILGINELLDSKGTKAARKVSHDALFQTDFCDIQGITDQLNTSTDKAGVRVIRYDEIERYKKLLEATTVLTKKLTDGPNHSAHDISVLIVNSLTQKEVYLSELDRIARSNPSHLGGDLSDLKETYGDMFRNSLEANIGDAYNFNSPTEK